MNTLVKVPIWKIVIKYLLILFGISMYCFAWSVFMVPSKIIGGGVVGLLHVEDISVSRIKTPEERFFNGQKINVMIKSIDKDNNKIVLSYKELLGNWDENIKEYSEKTVVEGIVKETDKFKNGIFIELKPNFAYIIKFAYLS